MNVCFVPKTDTWLTNPDKSGKFNGIFIGVLKSGYSEKMDHFLVSSDLIVLSQQAGPKLESDHKPVTAVVYIK